MIKQDWRDAPSEAQISALQLKFPVEPVVDEALSRKMRGRHGPAYLPQKIEDVAARLQNFLAARLAGPFEITGIRPLAGGSSKEQFAFGLTSVKNGVSAVEQLVLRIEPPEGTVQTHRLREFQALQALEPILPVPAPYWVDETGDELGRPALIYEFCSGVSRPPAGSKMSGAQQGYGDHYSRLLGPQFVDYLADIGNAPITGADLSSFVMPRAGTTDAAIMGIDWWERVWEEDRREAVPLMRFTSSWLRENAPVTDHISFVHGDYRTGNFLFDLETGRITALLDWELVRLGDRHEDLTYCMSPLMGAVDDNGKFLIAGFFQEDEFIARYKARSGLPVDPERIRYYRVFSAWRQMVITCASSHRAVLGRKTHQDILTGTSAMVAGVIFQGLHDILREIV